MAYLVLCFFGFAAAYILNMLYTSVFYHRGLTHRAFRFRRGVRRFVIFTGNWVTGIDPKTWVCMHRMHHLHSDTPLDPHSPMHDGVFRLIFVQLKSYGATMDALRAGDKAYTALVSDLNFPINWLNRNGFWYLPHLLQSVGMVIFGAVTGWWMFAFVVWFGLMSHPIQGWLVNSFGHYNGYRNHATNDNSRNNTLVAWLVMGEGFQNNHHHEPTNIRFSERWWEVDLGYALCVISRWVGLIDFRRPGPPVSKRKPTPREYRKAG